MCEIKKTVEQVKEETEDWANVPLRPQGPDILDTTRSGENGLDKKKEAEEAYDRAMKGI